MDFISKLVLLIVAIFDIRVHTQTAETRNCGTKYQNSIKTDEFVASLGSSEVKIKEVIAAFKIPDRD